MSNIFDQMVSHANGPPDPEYGDQNEPFSPFRQASEDLTSAGQLTPADVKRASMELLKHGYIEESQKQDLFRAVLIHERAITTILEPLDLELQLDAHRGVAFLRVSRAAYETADDDAAWIHPLVRRQRFTLEQSLLVAILRQAFVIHEQNSGVGQSAAKIAVHDLLPQFTTYFADSGSDARNETRLLSLLDQLKPHGIVSEIDEKQEMTIRPLIAYLANPASLEMLLRFLKDKAGAPRALEQ